MKQYVYGRTTLTYALATPNPKPSILIAAGFHGDEAGVIRPLTEVVTRYERKLPPFLFVPVASPSAVARGTRKNAREIDINRSYFLDTTEEEAQALMHLVAPFSFHAAYDFHEDDRMDRFYFYDVGLRDDLESIEQLKKQITGLGIGLFSGVDDEEDEALGLRATDGYIGMDRVPGKGPIKNGFFSGFLLTTKKAKRHFTFEIPGKANVGKKKKIVHAIFDTLILG